MTYPLTHNSWGPEERAAINRVLDSGRTTMGPEVAAFEKEFAYRFNVKHAVMVNSGSSANLLMLATLNLHPDFCFSHRTGQPTIIVPAVSWSTTYFPIQQYGYKLKFVDVDPLHFNIDPALVEQAIDEDTVAVLAVNLLGCPAPLDRLSELCAAKGVVLLEDNCESMGATVKVGGQYKAAGTIGRMGTFSFFYSHHISTMEGGMVVTDDDRLVDYLRCLLS